ncbi:MAG TPA: glycosyltransferase family 8 protein [Niabella sp.]
MDKTIHIVAATDNHYAVLLAALLKSVEINHKTPERIHFTVIDDGVSAKNKEKIRQSVHSDKIILSWVPSKKSIPAGITLPLDKTGFPLTAYLRIFAPYVVPEEAEKIIYLDVDTLVQADISDLLNIDLQHYLFGAILDVQETVSCSWAGIPNYKELGIPADTKYFNSGVLLINAQRWRKEQVAQRVMKALHENREYVNYADQYGLNVVLYNQWLEIDPEWNNFAFKEIENPKIIHFLDIKPIFTTYKSSPKYRELFFSYLNQTPFKNFKLRNGNKRFLKKVHTKLKKALLKITRL